MTRLSPFMLVFAIASLAGSADCCRAQPPKVVLVRGGTEAQDFERDLKLQPNVMTAEVGIANADKLNAALAKIGIGGGNGPAAIGDSHGKFWAVAAKINATIVGAEDTTFPISQTQDHTAIIITTSEPHGLATNDKVGIRNVGGNTKANGLFYVRVLSSTTFALYNPDGTRPLTENAYTSGGEWWNCRIIRIPERAGGTFFGTGRQHYKLVQTDPNTHEVNSATHEGRPIGGTTLVNTSDPSIIDTTSVIGYFGLGWSIGPMHINGAYARCETACNPPRWLDDIWNVNKMALIGFENTIRAKAGNTGKVILDLSYVNCLSAYRATKQPLFTGHGDHTVHLYLDAQRCRTVVGIDESQAVNNTFLHVSAGQGPTTFDLAGGGGNIHVLHATQLGGGTFLKASGLDSNTGRFDCDYLKVDTGYAVTRIIELTNQQTHSIRIKGQIGKNAATQNQNADQPFVRAAGRNTDIELDLMGLPRDEAIAWARKPYPTADQTVFATPDLGLDPSFAPDEKHLIAWFDATDETTIDKADHPARLSQWRGKFGTRQNLTQADSANQPLWIKNGLHHRPALYRPIGNEPLAGHRYLFSDSPISVAELRDFTLMAVAAIKKGAVGTGTVVGVWRNAHGGRSWRLLFNAEGKVQWDQSLDGVSGESIVSNEPVRRDTAVLIVVRRNATTGDVFLTVNGDVSASGQRLSSGDLHSPRSGARLGVFTSFQADGTRPTQLHSGWIQFIGIWNTNLDPDASEYKTIRSHWRRKAGVW